MSVVYQGVNTGGWINNCMIETLEKMRKVLGNKTASMAFYIWNESGAPLCKIPLGELAYSSYYDNVGAYWSPHR